MPKIINPEISAKILAVMEDVALSNNGYSQFAAIRPDVKRWLEVAGYVVKNNPDGIFGANSVIVFSAPAWAIFVAEQNAAVARLRDIFSPRVSVDFEAKIMARNADYLLS